MSTISQQGSGFLADLSHARAEVAQVGLARSRRHRAPGTLALPRVFEDRLNPPSVLRATTFDALLSRLASSLKREPPCETSARQRDRTEGWPAALEEG